MNQLTRRIGDASARRPWVTLGAWAVVAAVITVSASTLGGAFVEDFAAPGSQSEQAMDLLQERFGEAAGDTQGIGVIGVNFRGAGK